jgi:flagellar basal-body rod protein FlgB
MGGETVLSGITYMGNALALRNVQLEVLTSNLANASTPGYKARNLNFREAFQAALKTPSSQGVGNAHKYIQYQRGNPVGLDGNSVDPQQAMVDLTKAALASETDATFTQGAVTAMLDAIATAATY